jgi:hypothetical protein
MNKNKTIKFIAFTVVSVISLGTRFGNQAAMAKETKEYMLNICSTDDACQQVIDTYFEQCFNTNYRTGSRYTSANLDTDGLASCINKYAGVAYFQAE